MAKSQTAVTREAAKAAVVATRPGSVEMLPRRWREHVEALEREVLELRAMLAEGPEDTRLVARQMLEHRRLDDTQVLRFFFALPQLLDRAWIDVSLAEPYTMGGGDRSALHLNGSGGLVIQPSAGNAVYVSVKA